MNLSRIVGGLVSSRLCTLHEMQTVYSMQDELELSEVLSEDNYNRRQHEH